MEGIFPPFLLKTLQLPSILGGQFINKYIDVSLAGQAVTQQDSGGYYAVKLIENLPSGAKAYNILPFNRYVGGVSLSIITGTDGKQFILFSSSSSLTYPNGNDYIARIYYY